MLPPRRSTGNPGSGADRAASPDAHGDGSALYACPIWGGGVMAALVEGVRPRATWAVGLAALALVVGSVVAPATASPPSTGTGAHRGAPGWRHPDLRGQDLRRPLRPPRLPRPRSPRRAGNRSDDQARQEGGGVLSTAHRPARGPRPGDHRDNRLPLGGQRRRLLGGVLRRQAAPDGRCRRTRRHVRGARPAAGPLHLPEPGQALPRAAARAARRASPSTPSGG